MNEYPDAEWVQMHHPCDKCGSTDAASTDTEGWAHCFSCSANYRPDGNYKQQERTAVAEGLLELTYKDLRSRMIDEKTCLKYGYGYAGYRGETVQVAPYRRKGTVVSQHIRTKDKDFAWLNHTKGVELFGQHLWQEGGKQLIITEGEIDCLTWAQTRQLKWPVVAVPGVTSIQMIKDNLSWLSSFDEIVLYFDMDEPGQAAAHEVAALLPSGRARLGSTAPYKDANELVIAEGQSKLYDSLWQAQTWRPEELMSFEDALSEDEGSDHDVLLGVEAFDTLVGGLSLGELVMIGAGSNIGKSLLIRHLAAASAATGYKVGYFPLEEGANAVARELSGIPHESYQDNVSFFRDTGADLMPAILRNIEYLAVAEGVQLIFIDHITAVFTRTRADVTSIDEFLQELQALALRLQIVIIYNSHVKDPDRGSYSEGVMPDSSSFRGSGMLFRVPDVVLGASREINHETKKRVTTLQCLKHRHQGLRVGTSVQYTLTNGLLQLHEDDDEETIEEDSDF